MLKRILSIGLIVVLLFNLSGYFFIFKYNQLLIRSQVREWIRSGTAASREEVITLDYPLNSPDFKWIDKKEFSYKGKLYDVISRKITGKSIIFHCINDKEEAGLYAKYNTWFVLHLPGEYNGKANNTKAMLTHIIKHALVKGSFSFFVPYIIMDDHCPLSVPGCFDLTPPPSPPPEISC